MFLSAAGAGFQLLTCLLGLRIQLRQPDGDMGTAYLAPWLVALPLPSRLTETSLPLAWQPTGPALFGVCPPKTQGSIFPDQKQGHKSQS